MQLYPVREVLRLTGLGSRSSLWRAVRKGDFPAPKVISQNRICWFASDLDAWAQSLPTRHYSKPALKAQASKLKQSKQMTTESDGGNDE
jgi:prophage regulatory protein